MAINFPNTPTDGQVFVDPNGASWTYNAATNSWTSRAADPAALPPDASETQKGIVELATAVETTTGTDNTRAVHAAGLQAALAGYLPLAGGNLTGGVTQTEQAITAGAFDLATGNFWSCGAITVPNPTNAVAGMSGLIRVTAVPTGWGANFVPTPTVAGVPAIIPFYVESPTSIRLGKPVGVS